ncbi:NusG domain II-containing protein [Aquibacillus rhizosphaerae]|uniref:NusG domain II-containing protein n=1 Tax=Aquibacillus rhizosphaerae TaxID=3051431 RepID=A0ABT7LCV2_9BACI|nr:NusG domain II-containing protein [Aquibacillus sp. LR5S19]MDL4843005.1 NusG domain II-containing protein [Aquibacillus sp. LR5S19]
MRNYLRMAKPYDIIIIIILVLLSFTPLIIFSYIQAQQSGNNVVAVITQNGTVIREITLTGHEGNEEFIIEGKGNQYNLMEVDEGRIRIKEDNSPDQIGVKMGWKDTPGETIVCLPHKLFVEIKSENSDSFTDEDIIISQ